MTVKAAVVGTGVMGSHHARVYGELGVLCGVMDKNEAQCSRVARQNQTEAHTSLDQLLDLNPDVVSIAVPTPAHVEIAERCMRAGAHVLVEKPIAGMLEDARRLISTAEETGRILGVGYIERYNPAFRALQKIVKADDLGEIISVNIKRVGGVPRSADNVIIDLMTHDFNLLMALFGQAPNRVSVSKRVTGGLVNSAQSLLTFGSASAVCEANWASPVKIRDLHVTGTEGYCEVNLILQQVTRYKSNIDENVVGLGFDDFVARYGIPEEQVVAVFKQEPLREELSVFLHSVETGDASNVIGGQDALRTLEVTLEAAGSEL